jgi:hypothetical protein
LCLAYKKKELRSLNIFPSIPVTGIKINEFIPVTGVLSPGTDQNSNVRNGRRPMTPELFLLLI